jgi:D-arabinose 1-dehydrogenase-like Zn-dependent alcohol dehydrogenase
MKQSLNAVKKEGVITLIGVVTGVDAQVNVLEAISRIITMRGIHVGPKDQFEDMMAAMESNKIQPVIDEKVFQLEELVDALQYLVRLMTVRWRL